MEIHPVDNVEKQHKYWVYNIFRGKRISEYQIWLRIPYKTIEVIEFEKIKACDISDTL